MAECAPALIIAAGQDPLRDDAVRYAEALQQAGVAVRLLLYPDAVHGFLGMPRLAPEAGQALEAISEFLS